MPTIADGWCESIRTGACPERGKGVRSAEGVEKPPQNSRERGGPPQYRAHLCGSSKDTLTRLSVFVESARRGIIQGEVCSHERGQGDEGSKGRPELHSGSNGLVAEMRYEASEEGERGMKEERAGRRPRWSGSPRPARALSRARADAKPFLESGHEARGRWRAWDAREAHARKLRWVSEASVEGPARRHDRRPRAARAIREAFQSLRAALRAPTTPQARAGAARTSQRRMRVKSGRRMMTARTRARISRTWSPDSMRHFRRAYRRSQPDLHRCLLYHDRDTRVGPVLSATQMVRTVAGSVEASLFPLPPVLPVPGVLRSSRSLTQTQFLTSAVLRRSLLCSLQGSSAAPARAPRRRQRRPLPPADLSFGRICPANSRTTAVFCCKNPSYKLVSRPRPLCAIPPPMQSLAQRSNGSPNRTSSSCCSTLPSLPPAVERRTQNSSSRRERGYEDSAPNTSTR